MHDPLMAAAERESTGFRRMLADRPARTQRTPPSAILVVGGQSLHSRVLDAARDLGLLPVIETSDMVGAANALISYTVMRAVLEAGLANAVTVLAMLRARGVPVALIGTEAAPDLREADRIAVPTRNALKRWLVAA